MTTGAIPTFEQKAIVAHGRDCPGWILVLRVSYIIKY